MKSNYCISGSILSKRNNPLNHNNVEATRPSCYLVPWFRKIWLIILPLLENEIIFWFCFKKIDVLPWIHLQRWTIGPSCLLVRYLAFTGKWDSFIFSFCFTKRKCLTRSETGTTEQCWGCFFPEIYLWISANCVNNEDRCFFMRSMYRAKNHVTTLIFKQHISIQRSKKLNFWQIDRLKSKMWHCFLCWFGGISRGYIRLC